MRIAPHGSGRSDGRPRTREVEPPRTGSRLVSTFLLAIAAASACRLPPKATPAIDAKAEAQSVARGEPIYLQNCAPCHGATGEGDGPLASEYDPAPTNLVASGVHVSRRGFDIAISTPHYSSRLIEKRVTTGNREMPAWNEILTEEQIDDVVAYVRHLIATSKGS